jgi:flagellar FliL protein
MAEDIEEDDDDEEEDSDEESGGSKKLIIIMVLVVLLIIGGMAGAYFTGLLDSLLGGAGNVSVNTEQREGGQNLAGGVYLELPEMLVNLNTGARKSQFLKVQISLEIFDPLDIPKIEHTMPRIIDNFQVYLRELRLEDIKGAAGMYRLREELLLRVSKAVAPIKVKDVLFKEMLIQ